MQDENQIYIDLRPWPNRAGRKAKYNATAPDGSPGCRVVVVVSREDHMKWEDYKYLLSVEHPGRVFTNDQAFEHLLKNLQL
jgi:hypothetical protein